MTREEEQEANEFAMELLMPRDWILEAFEGYDGSDIFDSERIKKIAKKFGVTTELLVYRMGQLRDRQREK